MTSHTTPHTTSSHTTPAPTRSATPGREHLLAVVEPIDGEDAGLDLARDVVARGGRATVLMVITDRIRRDIEAYAKCENLSLGEAEARILDSLAAHCEQRSGVSEAHAVFGNGRGAFDLRGHATDATAISIPEQLGRRAVRSASRSGLPVVVTPRRAA